MGWIPLENMRGDVTAAPDQDAFSVGVDVCSILAKPAIKSEDVSIWSCSVRGDALVVWVSVGL